MAWHDALFYLLSIVLVLMLIGAPVAFAFIGANIVGAWYFMGGGAGLTQLLNNGFGSLSSFGLVPIPLFLLMGELFFRTGLGMRMFNAIDLLMGKVPGRLSYVTVVGGTAFSTLSGSSMGSTALLGSLLVPEMERRGYKRHMSIGPILGTGGLAIIIPPSAIAVLLATLAKIDIGDVLIGGIIPGLILASLYMVTIWIKTKIDPDAAPAYDVESMPLLQKLKIVAKDIIPMLSIIVMIVIMMLTGFATPSEAAAFGALGVIVLAALFRALSLEAFKLSVTGALKVTLMAYLIVFGSATFSQLLAFSGASSGLIQWAVSFDLPPVLMLMAMVMVLLALGTFMEAISIMMITVPFFFPLAQSLGFDLVWFSIVTLVALEVGFSTPPLGLNLFVMKGVAPAGTTMKEIYLAAIPYIICSILLLVLMVIFPKIVTWLPYLSTG
ncbi:TRAP transporter large permease [Granulosicoccus antarcticus]|uniref:TRAP transporter large permease protein n=1 Tax=Granulosicoccus antarcticus IMCC3135 TaxID=1192854 RepID=A0A2Z2NV78_9GAMM|nr:TRAP transporter large permease subunit [Granulosicoccus antarcticus]ASJ73931.1 C4-dicarboxylate TRAP transporter large permease protein DctM [Granulosicoccus antarcticus IMCC3135]